MLTTAHFENAAPLLADFDISLLLSARARMETGDPLTVAALSAAQARVDAGDPEGAKAVKDAQEALQGANAGALQDFMTVLGKGGKARTFRKLAAIAGASVDEILAAEETPAKWAAMDRAAAVRPFMEVFQEAMLFFSALVPTSSGTPACLPPPAEDGAPAEPKAPEPGPSAVS